MNTRSGLIRRSSPTSLSWPIVLILIGTVALALPAFTSFAIARVLAWVLFFDGIFQIFYAFRSEGIGRFLWKILIAALYIGGGLYLLANPLVKTAALTLLLALFFIIEGIIDLFTYLSGTMAQGSHWLLAHSLITISLGVMIWSRWPLSSLWSVGILAGVSILMNGITRLMLALTLRRHAH